MIVLALALVTYLSAKSLLSLGNEWICKNMDKPVLLVLKKKTRMFKFITGIVLNNNISRPKILQKSNFSSKSYVLESFPK